MIFEPRWLRLRVTRLAALCHAACIRTNRKTVCRSRFQYSTVVPHMRYSRLAPAGLYVLPQLPSRPRLPSVPPGGLKLSPRRSNSNVSSAVSSVRPFPPFFSELSPPLKQMSVASSLKSGSTALTGLGAAGLSAGSLRSSSHRIAELKTVILSSTLGAFRTLSKKASFSRLTVSLCLRAFIFPFPFAARSFVFRDAQQCSAVHRFRADDVLRAFIGEV
jgi:hypothetical protein